MHPKSSELSKVGTDILSLKQGPPGYHQQTKSRFDEDAKVVESLVMISDTRFTCLARIKVPYPNGAIIRAGDEPAMCISEADHSSTQNLDYDSITPHLKLNQPVSRYH
jgi:hypothetical protein